MPHFNCKPGGPSKFNSIYDADVVNLFIQFWLVVIIIIIIL